MHRGHGGAAAAMDGETPLRAAGRRLLRYLRPQRGLVALSMLAFFVSAALEPLLPALLAQLIDRGFQPSPAWPIGLVPVAVIGLFGLRGLFAFAGNVGFARATSRAVLALRGDLIESVMRADASLYASLSPGVAAARVINDPQNATAALVGASTSVLRDGVTLIALLGYLFYLNWQLSLVSLVTAPVLGFVVRRVQRRVIAAGSRSYESQVRLTGIVDDIARAWRVVRSFDAHAFERRRFGAEAEQLRRQTLKSVTAGALMTPLTQLVSSAGVALIVTLALVDARNGGATVGQFVAFLTALLMTIAPLRRLTDVTQPIVGGLIQARACFALIDTPSEPDTGTRELARARGELHFEQASVAYAGAERPALHEVDLHIPAGHTVALVGPSGSGKSTLVGTLLGFVAPRSGCVRLDGIDLASLRKAALRRQFAVVSQDIVLFDAPVADNVAYAQPRDDAKLEACLRAADIWDFVQTLPEGLATPIGVNGGRLSGGQRQRLAIARALYKDASVWVFDEATSALDSESERLVQQAIERWRGERTLLLIAHRLSTVRHADAIHVMAEGRIVESGRHEELMTRGGIYAAMVRAQAID
ncbi:MAG TPA: ABC transporter transmembrane domain-containing protein [Methylibium sp.]|nr:ABC transporter transmembrane domain-containing protein [Methylibium sp.]